jgi:hypothetical protein
MNIHMTMADAVKIFDSTGINGTVFAYLRGKSFETGDQYIVHLSRNQFISFIGGRVNDIATVIPLKD